MNYIRSNVPTAKISKFKKIITNLRQVLYIDDDF